MNDTPAARFERLSGYLRSDPDNAELLRDAAEAGIAAGALAEADSLAERLGQVLPLAPDGPYLRSVAAMRLGDFKAAAALLDPLLEQHNFANIRFNLAWSLAMLGDKARALSVLDAATVSEIAAAAMLKVQLMHEAGDFDGAVEEARRALELHPDDAGLCAAVGTLALDVEDTELAALCAGKAGNHPEALAVSGMLEMQTGDPSSALQTFSRAIEGRQHNPRAWIGRGLARMLLSDNAGAAADIDEGASQFGDHIGSWIAAGWAHFLGGDIPAAKTRFERALAIDPNFAESHGSLAVIDVAQGDTASARRRMTTALRLDRECFSAAMAQVLLSNDDPAKVQEIVAHAFSTPLNGEGLTVAGYMSGLVRPTVH